MILLIYVYACALVINENKDKAEQQNSQAVAIRFGILNMNMNIYRPIVFRVLMIVFQLQFFKNVIVPWLGRKWFAIFPASLLIN